VDRAEERRVGSAGSPARRPERPVVEERIRERRRDRTTRSRGEGPKSGQDPPDRPRPSAAPSANQAARSCNSEFRPNSDREDRNGAHRRKPRPIPMSVKWKWVVVDVRGAGGVRSAMDRGSSKSRDVEEVSQCDFLRD
jgi:hypothetical protein